ncbi:MAG: anthranilate synthase component I [Candidatus Solibacter usitatus]|nr:anthranilate synthase component I [Candidatus Solibacter usitatus]
MRTLRYSTRSGISVSRTVSRLSFKRGLKHLMRELDHHRGIYLSSGYEYPERYSRWDVASLCPPLEIVGRGREIDFRPLNPRGQALAGMFHAILRNHPHWDSLSLTAGALHGVLKPLPELFPEEQRSKQPSFFSILRALVEEFRHPKDGRLALVGAFGYDLLFQFDPIELKLPRHGAKDLHLFLCDDIAFMDRKREVIERYQYDFSYESLSTAGLDRGAEEITPAAAAAPPEIVSDHTPEEYAAKVETVRAGMKQGDYYEVVLRQSFSAGFEGSPSELFQRVQTSSPSPYEFLLQFGDEQLIGASPEMFVRVEGRRVETCPISGTARRTGDPLKDHDLIRDLLNSPKEESELTMCTDVDRNDKSRVCAPGSVKVIGRRLIERYAGLFHTVDHVEGILDDGFDSLDAFLSHMWAVTVIGAPKKAAAQAVEDLEKDARGWYGGAIGMLSLNGDINTGILIRTVHLKNGIARYPAGATLLYDSDPAAEEQETRLKATGFFRSLQPAPPARKPRAAKAGPGEGIRLLLIDNDDCFIQTLANYVRQTGAEVVTYRAGFPLSLIAEIDPDVLLISPGPGRPADFNVPNTVRHAASLGIPVFGVCLGLQGAVEAFGGKLDVLPYPMHGKPSLVRHGDRGVFEGLPSPMKVGRYHSLYALRDKLPPVFEITAESDDGVIMGVRHRELPVEAVQFHPESLLSQDAGQGLQLIANMIRLYGRARKRAS